MKRQRQKHEIRENQHLLQKRKTIVESVFAWIKQLDNFRRFTLNGLQNAKLQW
ncbi:MAG: transposase [Ignavibacteria bacterium]|nr:transposase [Ignavibacteria bacterium]